MSEPKEYRIRAVADFFAVPMDRLEVCATEFAQWLAINSIVRLTLGDALKEWPPQEYHWIDDGKGEARMILTGTDGSTKSVTVPLRGNDK